MKIHAVGAQVVPCGQTRWSEVIFCNFECPQKIMSVRLSGVVG